MSDKSANTQETATPQLPNGIQLGPGQGALPRLKISTGLCEAELYLHGAQVTSWKPAGADEVLFLSSASRWQDGKAIRGGIPICFPWFRGKAGSPDAPAHGVVRTRAWSLGPVQVLADGAVQVDLHTSSHEWRQPWWTGECSVTFRAEFGRVLSLRLLVTNTGGAPITFEQALHTYFQVADVRQAEVHGLDQTVYLDNMDGNARKVQAGAVRFRKQTDNAYLATSSDLSLADTRAARQLVTRKHNSATSVVWNPWEEGAATLNDLPPGAWQGFACVEASNIREAAIELAPGQTHSFGVDIEVTT